MALRGMRASLYNESYAFNPGPGKAARRAHCTPEARVEIRGVLPRNSHSTPMIEGIPPDFPGCSSSPAGSVFGSTRVVQGLIAMSDQLSIANMPIATVTKVTSIMISPWVNEPHPPLHKLLSSHDVARLTRRPSWLLTSLSLIGRFPRKAKFRGRAIGWRQSEVLAWLARHLNDAERTMVPRVCARRRAQQACLRLTCAAPGTPRSGRSETRKRKATVPATVRP